MKRAHQRWRRLSGWSIPFKDAEEQRDASVADWQGLGIGQEGTEGS
jgi:hypothetical protein